MRIRVSLLVVLIFAAFVAGCGDIIESDDERRMAFVAAHPQLDERTRDAVLEGKIFMGMPAAAVEASWGKPSSVNRSVGVWGASEQWVYRSGLSGPAYAYVYIENGVVSSWQLRR